MQIHIGLSIQLAYEGCGWAKALEYDLVQDVHIPCPMWTFVRVVVRVGRFWVRLGIWVHGRLQLCLIGVDVCETLSCGSCWISFKWVLVIACGHAELAAIVLFDSCLFETIDLDSGRLVTARHVIRCQYFNN